MMHLIQYRFKTLLRDRMSMFWALAFPLILGTFFYFAFGNIGTNNLDTISAAVVAEKESDETTAFVSFLNEMEKADSETIKITEMTEKEALKQLKSRKIKGIYYAQEVPELTVGGTGIEESVLQAILESYNQNAQMLRQVMAEKPEGMQAAVESLNDYQEMVTEVTINGKEVNGVIQYFFALIAMACMYGCFLGLTTVMGMKANLSELAMRRCIAPINRLRMVIVDMFVTFIIHFFDMLVLLAYLKYVLKLDFGKNMGGTILVCAVGSLIGVAFGIFIGSLGHMREAAKVGIMLSVSMVASFLSGLMASQIKNVVEQYCPIVNRINPAALITDALYCMSVYNNPERYGKDLLILTIMAVLLVVSAFVMVRRERYDSI